MKKRPSVRRIVLISVAIFLLIGIGYAIYWLQPMQATQVAQRAMQSNQHVTVSNQSEWISFLPAATSPVAAIIFYPGAKVDPVAYALYMRAFADKGYGAFIVKMPLNLAIFGVNRAADVIAAYPHIHTWVIGGHSLGGVFASQFAASQPVIKGLLLYASYPASNMSQRTGLTVISIYGTNDGLATPAKVAAARPLLPPTTQYIAIQGGIHGYFGDYGIQPGDGQPAIPRTQARQEIIAASLAIMPTVTAHSTLASTALLPTRMQWSA